MSACFELIYDSHASIFLSRIAFDSGSVNSMCPCRSYSWAENLLHVNESLCDNLLQKEVSFCYT